MLAKKIQLGLYLDLVKNSKLSKNFLALSLIQVVNFAFPLITIPYITRVFGPETFGLINFALYFISYFTLITNFGFEFSATKEISQNRDDWNKIESIFNNVLFTKLFLFCISTLLFFVCLIFVPKVANNKALFIIFYIGVLIDIFFPTWFFQGIEKLYYTSIFSFIIKIIFTSLVFFLIIGQSDVLLYPLLTIIGQIVVVIASLYIVTKKYKIRISLPKNIKSIKETIHKGFSLFLNNVIINLYTTTSIIILGFISGDYYLGLFAAAQKIVVIENAIINGPLAQAIFPNIAYKMKQNKQEGVLSLAKYLILIVPAITLASVITFTMSSFIIQILYGNTYKEAVLILKIIAFIPVFQIISNFFLIQGLLNLDKQKQVTLIFFVSAVISLSLNLLLIPKFNRTGVAISWFITELFVVFISFIFFNKEANFSNAFKKQFLTLIFKR